MSWRFRRTTRRSRSFILAALFFATLLAVSVPANAILYNGEPAIDILGQFTSVSSDTTADYVKGCVNNGASQIGFDTDISAAGPVGPPSGVIDATNHWLYVSDSVNNRVLVFPLTSGNLISSKTPSYVLGQTNFTTCAANQGNGTTPSQSSLSAPGGLAIDSANQLLYVADESNVRVLVFSVSSISSGMNATYVLGQPNFSATSASCVQAKGGRTTGLAFDAANNRLFVSEAGCNTVYVYNTGSLSSGMNAANVLGATSFTTGGGDTQSTFTQPYGLAYDATNQLLYVVDYGNARVLVFNVAPGFSNGENASYVLGQSNFTSSGNATTQSGLQDPLSVALDASNDLLFVADGGNNRVMAFPTASTGGPLNGNGENASYVFGQSNFTTNTAATTQSGMDVPTGVTYDSTNSYLYAEDGDNNRAMIFNVTSPGTPTAVAQSGRDACAIMGGALYCWGWNTDGELGLGNNTQYTTPQQVGTATNWTAISMGDPSFDPSACGIAGGALYCWGNNDNGEAGQGNTTQYTTPQQVGTDVTWTAISVSGNDACGIDAGKLYCWGINASGEDGQGNKTQYTTPQQVGSATNWVAVSTGGKDTCGIEGSGGQGALYCWGANAAGEDGTGPGTGAETNLVFVTSTTYNGDFGSTAATAILGANADCAARATAGGLSGTFDAWIGNSQKAPNGEFVKSVAPYVEANGTEIASNWTSLVNGSLSNGITETELGTTLSSGDVWTNVSTSGTLESANSTSTNCNGWTNGTSSDSGYYGVIGASDATWTFSSSNTAACNVTNSLYCFQQNSNPSPSTTPVQVGSATNWTAVSMGAEDTCGIAGGALYCWGLNLGGEDGLGNTSEYWSPQQVGSATNWITISIEFDGTNSGAACGIEGSSGSGSLYCWGSNTNGNLGQGNTTPSTTPEQVGTATNWSSAIYEADSVCAIQGGIVYCWGRNANGNVGIGNTTSPQKTPQAVATLGVDVNAVDELGQYISLTSTATVTWTQSGANNGPTALGFYAPRAVALDTANHYLYVSDTYNNRVLVYALNTDNSIPAASGGHTASYVLGQTALQGANASGNGMAAMNNPVGLAYDAVNQRLFVVDSANNRILVFSTSGGVTSGMSASYYLGSGFNNSASGFESPLGIAYDPNDNWLFVTDENNNRVTVYNVAPGSISSGENASYVLGQTGFNTGSVNEGGSSPSQSSMYAPYDVAYDAVNSRLFVADEGNERVLVFTSVSAGKLSNGENASYELGQASGSSAFTSSSTGSTASSFDGPHAARYDANNSRLFVADTYNNRVMVFNAGPSVIANGESASYVLGESTFGFAPSATTQSGFYNPFLLYYDPGSGRLFVVDGLFNNRIMIFDGTTLPAGDYFNP